MPASRAYRSSSAAAARMFATGSRRVASAGTPASAAPRSSAAPRKAMTPNAGARPGNSSVPCTICQRVSAQPSPSSSSAGTWNSAPAARNAESNGDGRETGGGATWATSCPAGQGGTGAGRQAANKTSSAGPRGPEPLHGSRGTGEGGILDARRLSGGRALLLAGAGGAERGQCERYAASEHCRAYTPVDWVD